MRAVEPGSFRYKALEAARDFKNSWIRLGQHLYTIHRDKLYRAWGFVEFEAYCVSEIGVRKATALKLLRSYAFLEREAPTFLKTSEAEGTQPRRIPGVEAVNALRLAQVSKRIPESQIASLKEEVLEGGKADEEVKTKVRYLLKTYAPKLTPEQKEDKRESVLRRAISSLKSVRSELSGHDFPRGILKELEALVDELEELQS